MGYRILYFYKKENAFYRERKTVNLCFSERETEDAVRIFFCGLPEYYGRRIRWNGWRGKTKSSVFPVPWNFGQLLRLMQDCLEYVSADACYLEEQFAEELLAAGFGLIPDRQRMCGVLIRRMSGQFRGIDSILYLKGESGERTEELPLPEALLRKLHCFFYLGEKERQYAAIEENLWEGYGMPVLAVRRTEELASCRIKRLLVIDDRPEGEADWTMLPGGCVYLDLWSDAGRRRQITENRADIKYVSEYLYLRQNLDTQEETGYNVREGNEQCQKK